LLVELILDSRSKLASSDLLGKATSPNVLASFQLQKYKSKIAKTLKKTKTPKKKNNHPK